MTDCCKKELINEKCIRKIVKKELFVEIRVSLVSMIEL